MKNTEQLLPKKRLPRGWSLSGRGGLLRDCAGMFAGGFLLAGVRLGGNALPVGACLIGALPLGIRPVSAALGAVLGYALALDFAGAAEMVALSALMLSALAVFQGTPLAAKRWFMPTMAAVVCAILGSVRLLGGNGSFGVWTVQWLAAGLCSIMFRSALRGNRQMQLALLAMAFAGLSIWIPYVDFGLLCAVALSTATVEAVPAAACGIALDMLGGGAGYATPALLLPILVCHALRLKNNQALSALAFLLLPNLFLLLLGGFTVGGCLAVAAGAAAGGLLRRFGVLSGRTDGQESAADRLENAAEILDILRAQLPQQKISPSASEAESVYDGAAERVCRCCARFRRCWDRRASETYADLTLAARGIIETGVATAESFPEDFRENCCHMDGFVTAINQELDGMLYRRRYRMELQESRQIMAEELDCLAQYLRAESLRQPQISAAEAAYLPEVGVCSMGKNGSRVSGDRGACFRGVRGDYYVLLCDGMGTGQAASRMSGETVRLLERLLKSGVAPDAALRILNGAEVLRGSERFTTIDLLHIDLQSGECALYKWGAAPSYWRSAENVKKIGTTAPPPGVGVGGGYTPERYQLSLKRGEMLVLVSDGAGGAATEAAIAAYSGESARELAALLISGLPAEDDMSAVVVSLRPCTS